MKLPWAALRRDDNVDLLLEREMTGHSEKEALTKRANGNLRDVASDVLAMAKKQGATEADVVVADGENLSVQIRLGSVDRLSKAREKRLGLRVFVGK